MSFLGGADGMRRDPTLSGARGPIEVQKRRSVRSDVLCAGTLACRSCDAPVTAGAGGLGLGDELVCPYCDRRGPARDFLSLTPPTRPARVVVRLTLR